MTDTVGCCTLKVCSSRPRTALAERMGLEEDFRMRLIC